MKTIQLNITCEFTTKTNNDYCMSVVINIEHLVPHFYTQNKLAEPSLNISRELLKHYYYIVNYLFSHGT